MDYWHDISSGKKVPDKVNVIIEIPKGSQNKYEYDVKNKIFKLDRILLSPMHYPGDYGFIPQTIAKDNDPLDVMVLISNPTHPGTLLEAKPIGVLRVIDRGKEDNKILCVANGDAKLKKIKSIREIEKHTLDEIEHFFLVYKQLERKKVKILGWKDAREAKKIILNATKEYKKKFKN
jgi:inorganic pyrophosphatase